MKRRNNKGQYTIDIHSHLMGFYLLCTTIAIGAYLQNHSKVMAYVDQMGAVDAESPHISSVYYPSTNELEAEGWTDAKVIPLEELAEKIEPTKAPKQAQKSEVEQYIIKKFGDQAEAALKIAQCESRYNPDTVGDQHIMVMDEKYGEMVGDSIGIMQVRTGGKEKNGHVWNRARANGMSADEFRATLKDYRYNIDYAKGTYDRQGWNGWYNCKVKMGV